MPYGRRYRKRYGRGRRRRVGYTSWGAAKYLAKKAWYGVRYLKGLVNAEKHYFDVDGSAGTAVDSSGTIVALSQVDQGDNVNNRQGNSILAKSLYWRSEVVINASATATTLRMIIFKDLMNQGDAITVAALLQNVNTFSPLDVNTANSRVQVLADKTWALSINGNRRLAYKRFIRINDHIKFQGTAGTGEFRNNLFVCFISNEPTNTPTIAFHSRLGFYDN